ARGDVGSATVAAYASCVGCSGFPGASPRQLRCGGHGYRSGDVAWAAFAASSRGAGAAPGPSRRPGGGGRRAPVRPRGTVRVTAVPASVPSPSARPEPRRARTTGTARGPRGAWRGQGARERGPGPDPWSGATAITG